MGDTLEVAIGTGLTLPHYPRNVRLTGVDLSRTKGEYSTRRPSVHVMAGDFRIQARDRLRAGIIERLVAVKTSS